MLYRLNRQLFVENGPTAYAETAREARATSDAYRLLRQAKLSAAACIAASRKAAA
ncbi:MAG TPA: hypothetical protein VK485_09660 [Sphingomicrobium sp.]|nr:hypothetical protein [Sphingomicrobium sp.]